jgi:cytoskeletal protein CcmA (bactofilin family)
MSSVSKNHGNIVIGEGVSVVGSFEVPGLALIEGSFEGDLSADELVVGEGGRLVGRVKARQADIKGQTLQELRVSGKLVVRGSGMVSGNAMYGELEVERGGTLQGVIKPIADALVVEPVLEEVASAPAQPPAMPLKAVSGISLSGFSRLPE